MVVTLSTLEGGGESSSSSSSIDGGGCMVAVVDGQNKGLREIS